VGVPIALTTARLPLIYDLSLAAGSPEDREAEGRRGFKIAHELELGRCSTDMSAHLAPGFGEREPSHDDVPRDGMAGEAEGEGYGEAVS